MNSVLSLKSNMNLNAIPSRVKVLTPKSAIQRCIAVFQSPVTKIMISLEKHLTRLSLPNISELEYNKSKTKLTKKIANLHLLLYGNTDTIPNVSDIDQVTKLLLLNGNNNHNNNNNNNDNDNDNDMDINNIRNNSNDTHDLFLKLIQNMSNLEFDAQRQVSALIIHLIRRCAKNKLPEYIASKTDLRTQSNIIISCLMKVEYFGDRAHRSHSDSHGHTRAPSLLLQEMAKRTHFVSILLNLRVPDYIYSNRLSSSVHSDSDDSVVRYFDEREEYEYPTNHNHNHDHSVQNETAHTTNFVIVLLTLVRNSSLCIACDAYQILFLLFGNNGKYKQLIADWLSIESNCVSFFDAFHETIIKLEKSENWLILSRILSLLCNILMQSSNYSTMLKYINDKTNLKMILTLMKNNCSQNGKLILEAFHIFKLFVVNPNKARDIHIILYKNRHRLQRFLSQLCLVGMNANAIDFETERRLFINEKLICISKLNVLSMPAINAC